MFRTLLFILGAIWVLRLFQGRQAAVKHPPASDFHPPGGAHDPSTHTETGEHPAFSSGDIVDGEFEEISGPQGP
jgi:hypothetical protein